MRKVSLIALAILLFAIPQGLAQVSISEVLYNPENSETNGEAVVLYNDGNEDLDLSGWILSTTTSATDVTFPNSLVIPSGGRLLIADNDFSLNKLNSSWPDADYEESITLSNTAGGVALMNGEEIIDAVGWGSVEDSKFFEGSPALIVDEGQSLLRIQDSNYNSDDFIASEPFAQFFDSMEVEVDFSVIVESNSPSIKSLEILTDDEESEGIQIKPIAGDSKTISLYAEINIPEGFGQTITAKAILDGNDFPLDMSFINSTTASVQGNVFMDYFAKPGMYNLSLVIESTSSSDKKVVSFEYLELSAFDVEQGLEMNLKAGESGITSLQVSNNGNVALDINIRGERLKNEAEHINVGDIDFSIDDFATSKVLSGKYHKVLNLEPGVNKNIELKVNALNTLSSGKYDGKIFVKATN